MAEKSSLLFPYPVTIPGGYGFTEEQSLAGEVQPWLFEAHNAVFTKDGLIAPRELWRGLYGDTVGHPAGIATEQFYPTYAGTEYFISINRRIYKPSTGSLDLYSFDNRTDDGLVAPTVPATTKHWKAVYLAKGNEYGTYFFADGEKPKYFSGDAYFSQIPTGPESDIAHAAFGRIWVAVNNGTRLQWSDYLRGMDWVTSGTGSLDLSMNLGQDERVTAIADFNNFLILFTNRGILIFENPFNVPVDVTGTVGAADTLKLKEKIDGTGCVGVNAWASVGEDLFFVSYSGLYRLSRLMNDGGSNPLGVVCPQINHSIVDSLSHLDGSGGSNPTIRLNYHSMFGFLSLETYTVHYGIFLIWLTRPIDKTSFAVTQWANVPQSRRQQTDLQSTRGQSNTSIFGMFSTNKGNADGFGRAIVAVIINRDSNGVPTGFAGLASYGTVGKTPILSPVVEPTGFEFRIKSAWLNFGENPAGPTDKITKDMKIIYRMPRSPDTSGGVDIWSGYTPQPLTVRYTLNFDYNTVPSRNHTFVAPLDTLLTPYNSVFPSRYNISPVPLSGSGSLVQWELVADITNWSHESFAVQRMGLQAKLGRINQGI